MAKLKRLQILTLFSDAIWQQDPIGDDDDDNANDDLLRFMFDQRPLGQSMDETT